MSPASDAPPATRTLAGESDWLNSQPVFYNVRTGAVSEAINEVVDLSELEFDPDGLTDYLAAGYCLFERTPVRDVRFLPPNTRLWRDGAGRLELERLPDPAPAYLGAEPDEEAIFERLHALVEAWLEGLDKPVVIPTSGGFDSRMLNMLVEDHSRVHAYSYALTEHPRASYEIKRARMLSERLGTRWEFVELGDFHRYLQRWDEVFGPAVHSHGMYHYEFYAKVEEREGGGPCAMLSGAAGDYLEGARNPLWRRKLDACGEADTRQVPPIESPEDVRELLIVSFHRNADPAQAVVRGTSGVERYFEENREALRNDRLAAVEATRLRMMLLHYLVRVPRSLGWDVLPPFVSVDVSGPMLALPWPRRCARQWMRDYFIRRGVDLDDLAPRHTGKGVDTLDYRAMRRVPLRPLDEERLREVVEPEYVAWVNRNVGPRGLGWDAYEHVGARWGFHQALRPLRRLGVRGARHPAYFAYLTLKPLENLLRRRDAAQSGRMPEAAEPPAPVGAAV